MKLTRLYRLLMAGILLFISASGVLAATPIRNIVIVHAALSDGSGWRRVFDALTSDGYRVTIVQQPMTSLADDVRATLRVLELQDGPAVLVGHSYGGVVITEAGNAANVAGLVYIAAFQPDTGESLIDLASQIPGTRNVLGTADGFLYLDPKAFAADFAADLPPDDAYFMAHSQVFPSAAAFNAQVERAAWRAKRSWALITTEDRSIHPDLLRMMAKRAGSVMVDVVASHAVHISQPQAVAGLIKQAAQALAE
jgi:pimeloyl-ACP methyl ester carboxylesterase